MIIILPPVNHSNVAFIVRHDGGKRVPEILLDGKFYNRRFTAEDPLEELEDYINVCARKHSYGYDFQPTDDANFKYMGALNMCIMEDYVSTQYKEAKGIATPWGMAAPAGTITGLHLEDRSKFHISTFLIHIHSSFSITHTFKAVSRTSLHMPDVH